MQSFKILISYLTTSYHLKSFINVPLNSDNLPQCDSKRRERKFVTVFLGCIGQAGRISRTDNLRSNSRQDYRYVRNSRYCRDNLLRHLLDIGVISSINMGSTTGKECCLLSVNTLRTGLLNCLNARSRGLNFRHRASCI